MTRPAVYKNGMGGSYSRHVLARAATVKEKIIAAGGLPADLKPADKREFLFKATDLYGQHIAGYRKAVVDQLEKWL